LFKLKEEFAKTKRAPLFKLFKNKYLTNKKVWLITFKGIRRFLHKLNFTFLPEDLNFRQTLEFVVDANKKGTSNTYYKKDTETSINRKEISCSVISIFEFNFIE
jgi:hypothetical protein